MIVYITNDCSTNVYNNLVDSHTFELIVKFVEMQNNNDDSKSKNITPALRIIGNTISSTEDIVVYDILIKHNLLDVLENAFTTKDNNIRKEILWAFSNIAGSGRDCIQRLIYHNFFYKLCICCLEPKQYYYMPREALWIICNCINGSDAETQINLFKF